VTHGSADANSMACSIQDLAGRVRRADALTCTERLSVSLYGASAPARPASPRACRRRSVLRGEDADGTWLSAGECSRAKSMRMHGGTAAGIGGPKGERNGRFKTGRFTQQARERRREARELLSRIRR
jgi:hypothetical protein